MKVSYDEAKRSLVLRERGLDISLAAIVFESFHLTRKDEKHSGAEDRYVSVGLMNDIVVLVVWTIRENERRIITMWTANDRERTAYYAQRERSG